MTLERQTTWGWAVAGYLFLAGLGGGVFLFSFIFDLLDMYEPVTRIGSLVGPLLVLLGTFFLLLDLGSANKAYKLFITPSTFGASWLTKGAWILTAFIVFGLLYSLPAFPAFAWLPWNPESNSGLGIGITAAILAVLVVAYPGFLLGVAKGIPFWNTSTLPLLFFVSGLDTGIALLSLTALFFKTSFDIAGFHLLGIGDLVLIVFLLLVLAAYIEIARKASVTTAESVRLLKTPFFLIGVIIVGILVPLVLLIYNIFVTDALVLRIIVGINSVFLLAGGLFLRYSIIRAGITISFIE